MKFSWIQKTTLVDYPGKVACIVFTPWCNFRCPFCHNPEFVLPKELQKIQNDMIPSEIVLNFLDKRKWLIDGVSICGWEPTIHQDLPDFISDVKKKWFLVKLDTNWSNFEMLENLLKNNMLDYVAMDVKFDFENYKTLSWVSNFNLIQNVSKSIKLLINSDIDYEFRTTIIKGYHTEEKLKKIWEIIKWAKTYYLQNYRSWKTLDPNFDWESFSEEEIKKFQALMSNYVGKCEFRE